MNGLITGQLLLGVINSWAGGSRSLKYRWKQYGC